MGIFGKKKEIKQAEVLNISAEQLCTLIKKAIQLVAEDVEAKSYTLGPEIMFEYKSHLHFAGIRYDKKRARKENRTAFSNDLSTVYLDKDEYATVEELFEKAILDGETFSGITQGIIVNPEYKELL